MIGMNLKFSEDKETPAWPDLDHKNCIHMSNDAPPIQIVCLDGGMVSGRPSIAMRLDLPNGQTVICESTARLLVIAARAIEARYPDLMRDDA